MSKVDGEGSTSQTHEEKSTNQELTPLFEIDVIENPQKYEECYEAILQDFLVRFSYTDDLLDKFKQMVPNELAKACLEDGLDILQLRQDPFQQGKGSIFRDSIINILDKSFFKSDTVMEGERKDSIGLKIIANVLFDDRLRKYISLEAITEHLTTFLQNLTENSTNDRENFVRVFRLLEVSFPLFQIEVGAKGEPVSFVHEHVLNPLNYALASYLYANFELSVEVASHTTMLPQFLELGRLYGYFNGEDKQTIRRRKYLGLMRSQASVPNSKTLSNLMLPYDYDSFRKPDSRELTLLKDLGENVEGYETGIERAEKVMRYGDVQLHTAFSAANSAENFQTSTDYQAALEKFVFDKNYDAFVADQNKMSKSKQIHSDIDLIMARYTLEPRISQQLQIFLGERKRYNEFFKLLERLMNEQTDKNGPNHKEPPVLSSDLYYPVFGFINRESGGTLNFYDTPVNERKGFRPHSEILYAIANVAAVVVLEKEKSPQIREKLLTIFDRFCKRYDEYLNTIHDGEEDNELPSFVPAERAVNLNKYEQANQKAKARLTKLEPEDGLISAEYYEMANEVAERLDVFQKFTEALKKYGNQTISGGITERSITDELANIVVPLAVAGILGVVAETQSKTVNEITLLILFIAFSIEIGLCFFIATGVAKEKSKNIYTTRKNTDIRFSVLQRKNQKILQEVTDQLGKEFSGTRKKHFLELLSGGLLFFFLAYGGTNFVTDAFSNAPASSPDMGRSSTEISPVSEGLRFGQDTTYLMNGGKEPHAFAGDQICHFYEGGKNLACPAPELLGEKAFSTDQILSVNSLGDFEAAADKAFQNGYLVQVKPSDTKFYEIVDGTEPFQVVVLGDDNGDPVTAKMTPGGVLLSGTFTHALVISKELPHPDQLAAFPQELSQGVFNLAEPADFQKYPELQKIQPLVQFVQVELETQQTAIRGMSQEEIATKMALPIEQRGWSTNQEIVDGLFFRIHTMGYSYGNAHFDDSQGSSYTEKLANILKENTWNCEMDSYAANFIIRLAQKDKYQGFNIYLRLGYAIESLGDQGWTGKFGHAVSIFSEVDQTWRSYAGTLPDDEGTATKIIARAAQNSAKEQNIFQLLAEEKPHSLPEWAMENKAVLAAALAAAGSLIFIYKRPKLPRIQIPSFTRMSGGRKRNPESTYPWDSVQAEQASRPNSLTDLSQVLAPDSISVQESSPVETKRVQPLPQPMSAPELTVAQRTNAEIKDLSDRLLTIQYPVLLHVFEVTRSIFELQGNWNRVSEQLVRRGGVQEGPLMAQADRFADWLIEGIYNAKPLLNFADYEALRSEESPSVLLAKVRRVFTSDFDSEKISTLPAAVSMESFEINKEKYGQTIAERGSEILFCFEVIVNRLDQEIERQENTGESGAQRAQNVMKFQQAREIFERYISYFSES